MALQAARDLFFKAVGDAVVAATAPGHQPEPRTVLGCSDMGMHAIMHAWGVNFDLLGFHQGEALSRSSLPWVVT